MNNSEQIAELLNKINKPTSPLQKRAEICRVRTYGTFDNGNESQLLFNVEPITNPNYQDKTAWKETFNPDGSRDKLTKVMTNDELKNSMNNWIFNVTINADPNKSDSDVQAGLFILPKLDSYVVIEWFNETDAYISLTSEISKIIVTNENGDSLKFTPESAFKVNITTEDVELIISKLVKLRAGCSYIDVASESISIGADGDVNIGYVDPYGSASRPPCNLEPRDIINGLYIKNNELLTLGTTGDLKIGQLGFSSLDDVQRGLYIQSSSKKILLKDGEALLGIDGSEQLILQNRDASLKNILDNIQSALTKINAKVAGLTGSPTGAEANILDIVTNIPLLLKTY